MIYLTDAQEASGPDVWAILANAGTVVTLIAGALSIVGAFSYWYTRPTATIEIDEAGAVDFTNRGRSRPLRGLFLEHAELDGSGIAIAGAGADIWGPELPSGSGRLLRLSFAAKLRPPVTKFGHVSEITFHEGNGAAVRFRWQGPVIPWNRGEAVVVWTAADRLARRPPTLLRGRKAHSEWERIVPR